MQRKVCPVCSQHPVALNYYRGDRPYYRSLCTGCIHKGKKIKPEVPNWFRAGYRKPERCDRCSFKFKLAEQANVYYIDGNTNNANWSNLRTICLNCQQEILRSKVAWRPSEIKPDF